MNDQSTPFTSSVEFAALPIVVPSVTINVKVVDAVCPAEFTVTAGI